MTQATEILRALKKGRAITPRDAYREFGSLRLGARIYDLRKAGHKIRSERIEVKPGTRVARYSMRRGTQ